MDLKVSKLSFWGKPMHTEMKGTNRDAGRKRDRNLVQSFSISLICWHMAYSITKNKIPLGR